MQLIDSHREMSRLWRARVQVTIIFQQQVNIMEDVTVKRNKGMWCGVEGGGRSVIGGVGSCVVGGVVS